MSQGPILTATASSLPVGATQITATSGSVAAGVAAATLAAATAKSTYITGLSVTAAGATAAAAVSLTITGVVGGPLTYVFTAPAGVGVPAPSLNLNFTPPLKSSAVNTAIVVSLPSLGSGNTAAAVNAYGYQQ